MNRGAAGGRRAPEDQPEWTLGFGSSLLTSNVCTGGNASCCFLLKPDKNEVVVCPRFAEHGILTTEPYVYTKDELNTEKNDI